MQNNSLLNKALLLLLLVTISGCVNSESLSTSSNKLFLEIKSELDKGKIILVYQMLNKDKKNEQYADWSAYLNDFLSLQASSYKVYETNAEFNIQLANNKLKTKESYTLFLKKGKPSYFYEGVIVEPMVYLAVDSRYTNKKPIPMHQVFLPDQVAIVFK